MNKFDRSNFFRTVTVQGINRLDFQSWMWVRFPKFIDQKQVATFRVNQAREFRLDLIADDFYSDTSLWWLLALVNKILDPVSEVSIGKVLIIPSLVDIEDFYQAIQARKRLNSKASIPQVTV